MSNPLFERYEHIDPLLAAIAARVGRALDIDSLPSAPSLRHSVVSQDIQSWAIPFQELEFDRQIGQGPSGQVGAAHAKSCPHVGLAVTLLVLPGCLAARPPWPERP